MRPRGWYISRKFHNLNVLKLEMLDAVNGNSWHCSFKHLKMLYCLRTVDAARRRTRNHRNITPD